jgi:hypothetical protein
METMKDGEVYGGNAEIDVSWSEIYSLSVHI